MLIFIYLLVNIPVRVESQGAPDDEAKKTVLEEYIRQYRKLFKMSKNTICWQFIDNLNLTGTPNIKPRKF